MRKSLHLAAAGVLGLSAVGAAADASAFQIFDPSTATCTGTNCSSVVLGGTVNGFGGSAGPWIGALFAGTNNCLRLDVLSQGTTDLEIVAVAPDGAVFRNDDRPGSLLPLVKVNGTQNGWYTVSISQFAGTAVQANFTLAYGIYNAGNANCATPTVPFSARQAESAKGGASAGPAVTGGPGR